MSDWVATAIALEPEKPVRYLIFGRLVRTIASIFSATSLAPSAASRSLRRSAIVIQPGDNSSQGEVVTVRAETTDYGGRRFGKRRFTSLRLTRVDVREVHFDKRNRNPCERIANRET